MTPHNSVLVLSARKLTARCCVCFTSGLFFVLDVDDHVVEQPSSSGAQRVEVTDVAVHVVEQTDADVL